MRQNTLLLQIFLYGLLMPALLLASSATLRAEPQLSFLPEVEEKLGRGM